MTIPKPFTQREIEARRRLGFGPVPLKPVHSPCYDLFVANFELLNENRIHQVSSTWDFNEAVEILAHQRGSRVVTGKDRDDCRAQIDSICRLDTLERLAEKQETNGAKASAFQKARRWNKWRKRALPEPSPWLPQSLEQEAGLLQAAGASPDESFVILRDWYRSASRPGRGASLALLHTVQRLQLLASHWVRDLGWTRRNTPTALIDFLVTVLDAAGIRHPGFVENPSKLRRLMLKPARRGQKPPRKGTAQPPTETELERRLSKTPL